MATENGNGPRRGLLRSPVFSQVRAETRAALQTMCRVKTYAAGQTIVAPEQQTAFIGCVLSGVLRMQKTLADGREHIVGLLVEGDMFGRVFDGVTEFSIEAATDAQFCSFQRRAFESLLTSAPDLERAVLLNISNELDRAREWMIILSNQRIAGRLAGFLLLICARFRGIDHILQPGPEGVEVKIPIGRLDLAHLLGTRPESISRALHALADRGDIDLLAPDRILIRNFEALAHAANEDDAETARWLTDLLPADRLPR